MGMVARLDYALYPPPIAVKNWREPWRYAGLSQRQAQLEMFGSLLE